MKTSISTCIMPYCHGNRGELSVGKVEVYSTEPEHCVRLSLAYIGERCFDPDNSEDRKKGVDATTITGEVWMTQEEARTLRDLLTKAISKEE